MAKEQGPMKKKSNLAIRIWQYRYFYIMFLPVLVALILFYYLPMIGVRFSFYKYTPFAPPTFVGWDNFRRLWSTPTFWDAFRNTLQISIFKLFLNMFLSVSIALLINEIVNLKIKKAVQTIIYLPHFLSWVVVASIFMIILSPQGGFVNQVLLSLGIIKEPIYFLAEEKWWRPVYYFINQWKETGWGTIIYLATLTSISPELYEAASIDGAGRWKQTLYITIPSIMDTVIIVLILNLAKVLNLFESVFVLYNPLVYHVSDVLQTYVYRLALNANAPDYGFSTAVGLFKSVVSCILVLFSNWASKKVRGRGIL
ncbi:MAG: sugar ABC transporter permease [Epulopiscium sp.]|nr:sugar ABC transporter permease [Candidatus Epulonipiscium sp.]